MRAAAQEDTCIFKFSSLAVAGGDDVLVHGLVAGVRGVALRDGALEEDSRGLVTIISAYAKDLQATQRSGPGSE